LESNREEGEWEIADILGISVDTFWDNINAQGERFWTELEPLPWCMDLIEMVGGIMGSDNWYIATSPSRKVACYTGKLKWIKNMFGNRFDRFFISPYKSMLAKEGVLLIDDRERNVKKFTDAGGDGIMFPHASNTAKKFLSNPVGYIQALLCNEEGMALHL
jgi:5'(3')-deoxyribonucleotidase